MEKNKIVVKFKDGTSMKGQTANFFPNKTMFHLERIDGKIVEITIEHLKAIFFVKDYEGNKNHVKTYNDIINSGGKKLRVKFIDGEEIIGFTLSYSPDRQGFFLTPADLKGNNDRVFVVKSSAPKIEFI
ncbi:MAG: hypothetical protein JW786_08155 [Desulfobacterales bacterium]|nr:hypothetical protein [Desulfobacterales bacterium]